MKRLSLIALVAAFVVSAFAFLASSAFAIPVFARKYNTQCNMCHTVPPRLNKFGVAFKENGFELPPGTVLPESEVYGNQVLSNEEPKAIVGAGFPFMIRTGVTADLAVSTTTAGVATNNVALGAAPGEFGLISGGSLETSIGGLGFWIDAPGAAIGAIDFDFNFNPLFKVSVGNDAPKVGYALGLTPIYIGGVTTALTVNRANVNRNPATIAAGPAGFVWGDAGVPGVEIRGTTNAATGLGLNYAIGYRAGFPAAQAVAPAQSATVFYGHVSYFIDAINSNLGVGISSEQPAAVAAAPSGGQTLIDFTYGVGENMMLTLVYNSIRTGVAGPGNTTNYFAVQPEVVLTPEIAVGGRYTTYATDAAGAISASVLSVGVNYKLDQNILTYLVYNSTSNVNAAGLVAANNSSSALITGLDFIF